MAKDNKQTQDNTPRCPVCRARNPHGTPCQAHKTRWSRCRRAGTGTARPPLVQRWPGEGSQERRWAHEAGLQEDGHEDRLL